MRFIPDHLKMQEMCYEVMRAIPNAFHLIPNHCKNQWMCTKAIEENSCQLYYVPDHIKTQGLSKDAFEEEPTSLPHVPNWLVRQQQIKNGMMMTMSIAMMMIMTSIAMMMKMIFYVVQWLSKTQVTKSRNKRRVNALCLASIKMVGLVCS